MQSFCKTPASTSIAASNGSARSGAERPSALRLTPVRRCRLGRPAQLQQLQATKSRNAVAKRRERFSTRAADASTTEQSTGSVIGSSRGRYRLVEVVPTITKASKSMKDKAGKSTLTTYVIEDTEAGPEARSASTPPPGRVTCWIKNRPGEDQALFVSKLQVEEQYRRQGFGTWLMDACEERAAANAVNTLALCVTKNNAEAAALYEKCGYSVVAGDKGPFEWLADPETLVELKLEKYLNGAPEDAPASQGLSSKNIMGISRAIVFYLFIAIVLAQTLSTRL